MCLINIREYYEKDGKMLPGKKVCLLALSSTLFKLKRHLHWIVGTKGISLSVDQYRALLKAAPGINASLRDLGEVVEDGDENITEGISKSKVPSKERSKSTKANIDATSDEESS